MNEMKTKRQSNQNRSWLLDACSFKEWETAKAFSNEGKEGTGMRCDATRRAVIQFNLDTTKN